MDSHHKSGFPSKEDLMSSNKISFIDAGKDYPSIAVESERNAKKEMHYLADNIVENFEWFEYVKAVKRAISLINGGLLNFESCTSDVNTLIPGLIAGILSSRSAVVKSTCLFISLLAQKLKSKITIIANIIDYLSKQTSNGTMIIAHSCQLTILEIVKNCPKSQILKNVFDLLRSKATINRKIVSDAILFILDNWPESIIENNSEKIKKALLKLLNDSNAETRLNAKSASKLLIEKYPNYKQELLENLNSKQREAILNAQIPKMPQDNEISEENDQDFQEIVFKNPRFSDTINESASNNSHSKKKSKLPQRRSKSMKFKLDNGKENEFLQKIEESRSNQDNNFIRSNIISIVHGLMNTITINEGEFTDRTLMLIYYLIQEYPKDFENSLGKLFQVFFGITGDNELVRSILTIITDSYDPNLLIDYCAAQLPSVFLLSYIAEIVGLQGDKFSNRESDLKLLKIAERQYKNHEAEAKKITLFIAENNKLLLKEFRNSCSEDFLFIIDEILCNDEEDVSIPDYNPEEDFEEWGENLFNLIKSLTDNEWQANRRQIYEKIVAAIEPVEIKETVFDLLFNIIDMKGIEEYDVFLCGLFTAPGFKRSVSSRKILLTIEDTMTPEEIINMLYEPLDGENKQFAAACINEISFLAVNYRDIIEDQSESITNKLIDYLSNNSIVIRKAAVLCIATLANEFGSNIMKIIRTLPTPKQKLIDSYIENKK